MAKILCTCGHIIYDQSDFIRNKAHFMADQDYTDFFEEVAKTDFMKMTSVANERFGEIFQCDHCHSLIIFRQGMNTGTYFTPQENDKSKHILRSYLGDKWLGTMSANFSNGKGEIFWSTNIESGFRQNLDLEELRAFYKNKFEELSKLKILRHSFLRIDNKIEHEFDNEQKNNS